MLKLHQLSDISELQAICEKQDHIMLKLNWDMLKNRAPGSLEDFFDYEDGELRSFLALYRFGANVEICGMTHPDYRRQGRFSKLWKQVTDSNLLENKQKILFNIPHSSKDGQQWASSRHAGLHSVEYTLKLGDDMSGLGIGSTELVSLRPFTQDDAELWARLDAEAFDISEFSTLAALSSPHRSLSRVMHIIEYQGLAAGKIEVDRQGEHSWIYGFVVDPALRGHGIGRSALRQVTLDEKAKGKHVWLDVVADNARALHLYESCGFVHEDVQDYYEYVYAAAKTNR